MGREFFDKLAEKYPFITLCIYADLEYIGIVQNRDDTITTIYDFGVLISQDQKQRFIELANVWWWESIRYCLRTFMNRDLTIIHGPVCSLNDISKKRTKRKSITLVRRVD